MHENESFIHEIFMHETFCTGLAQIQSAIVFIQRYKIVEELISFLMKVK